MILTKFQVKVAATLMALASCVSNVDAFCDKPKYNSDLWFDMFRPQSSTGKNRPSTYTAWNSWHKKGLSPANQKTLSFQIMSAPDQTDVKYLVMFAAGKQAFGGSPQTNTGQHNKYKNSWSNKAAQVSYAIDGQSTAGQFYTQQKFPLRNTYMINMLDAAFDHENSFDQRMAAIKGWIEFLKDKVNWSQLKGVYLNGMSRGGCFMARFFHELVQADPAEYPADWQNVKVIFGTNDPVCRNDEWLNDLSGSADGLVSNPRTNRPDWKCYKSDIDNAFKQTGNVWQLLPRTNICWQNIIGGDPAADAGVNIGRAYCHKSTNQDVMQSWCAQTTNVRGSVKCDDSTAQYTNGFGTITSISTTNVGTINKPAYRIIGSGTSFTTEVKPGDQLYKYFGTGTYIGRVSKIIDNLTLEVDDIPPSTTLTGYYKIVKPWYTQRWVRMMHCEIGRYFKRDYLTNPTTWANGHIEDIVDLQLTHFDACKARMFPEWGTWSACSLYTDGSCGGYKRRYCNTSAGYTCANSVISGYLNGVAYQQENCVPSTDVDKCVWGPDSAPTPACQAHDQAPAQGVKTNTCGKAGVLYASTIDRTNAILKKPCPHHGATKTNSTAIPFCTYGTAVCNGVNLIRTCNVVPSPTLLSTVADVALDTSYASTNYTEDPVTIVPLGPNSFFVSVPTTYAYPPQDAYIAESVAATLSSPYTTVVNGYNALGYPVSQLVIAPVIEETIATLNCPPANPNCPCSSATVQLSSGFIGEVGAACSTLIAK